MADFIPVPTHLTDLDGAFPTRGPIDKYLPPYEEIPAEFQHDANAWTALGNRWFVSGLKGVGFIPKDGVDPAEALKAIGVIQGCWGLKHEHKQAGVGFLFDQWFKDYVDEGATVTAIHGIEVRGSDDG